MKNLLETLKPWKTAAEKYGLENYQTHAPFPSAPENIQPTVNGEYEEYMVGILQNCIHYNVGKSVLDYVKNQDDFRFVNGSALLPALA